MTASTFTGLTGTIDRARARIGDDVEAAQREVADIEARMRHIDGLLADPLDEAFRVLRRTVVRATHRLRGARGFTRTAAAPMARHPLAAIGVAFAAGVVASAMAGWVGRRSAALAATPSTLAEFGDDADPRGLSAAHRD